MTHRRGLLGLGIKLQDSETDDCQAKETVSVKLVMSTDECQASEAECGLTLK